MTYDSSVFSRGNYYKDSFYFKNTKGFRHIFTVNIPLHSKKKRSMLLRKGQPVRQTDSSAPKLRLRRRGGAPAPNRKIPGVPSARQKKPPRKPGRAKFQGWLADCIGRGHKSTSFLTLQNYPAAIS